MSKVREFFRHYRGTIGYVVVVGMAAYILFTQSADRQSVRCAIVEAFDTYTNVLIQASQLDDETPPTAKEKAQTEVAKTFIAKRIREDLAPLHPELCK